MKHTLLVTQQCNLACDYCYIGQRPERMPLEMAKKIVAFAYRVTPSDEKLEVGFFGGEPLLEFDRVCKIVDLFERDPRHDPARVLMTVVTNGTILSSKIVEYLRDHGIALGISCDGPPDVHDASRRFRNGDGSSARVEENIRRVGGELGPVMVNAVYRPRSLPELPRSVAYLSSLGVRQIYLTPDHSAPWRASDVDLLPAIYGAVGRQYLDYYLGGDPHFISLVDSKIAVILRGGYDPLERCRMGRGEFAFSPQGTIYPCERLVGDGTNGHGIGDVDRGIDLDRMLCRSAPGKPGNDECLACALKDHCMNWCGCSNFFASGFYNRVSPFQCASEKASIRVAFEVYQALEERLGPVFYEHLSGRPQLNSMLIAGGGC